MASEYSKQLQSVRMIESRMGGGQYLSEDARRSGSLFQAHLRRLSESKPCFPPHPNVLQKHVAPREITIALLAFTFSDVTPLTNEELMAHYSSPAIVSFLDTISSNCTKVHVVPIQVPLSVTQQDDKGRCRVVHADALEAMRLSAIPEWENGQGKIHSKFNATVLVPVSSDCSTAGVTGQFGLNVKGKKFKFVGIFLGLRKDTRTSDGNELGDRPGINRIQLAYVHEIGHLLGHQYHSNAYQCLDPSTQKDVLDCSSYEYGDDFDIMGGFDFSTWMNARSRYNFGWLGKDDLSTITFSSSQHLRALGSEGHGPRAAVIPDLDLWFEFRSHSDASNETGRALQHNHGLFLRRWNNLIDASLGSCKAKSISEWHDTEHREVTLGPGRVLALRDQGISIGDVVRQGDKMTFSVDFGERAKCEHRVPVIDVGMTGEWKFGQNLSEEVPVKKRHPLFSHPKLANFSRATTHYLQNLRNRDRVTCNSSTFEVGLGSELPAGWAFVSQKEISLEPGGGVPALAFAFGIPKDAADGDYDFCITATNSLGYRTAKIMRLSLPESKNEWYTNNRPAYYEHVDSELAKKCSEMEGCAEDKPHCVVPKPFCDLDLTCGTENRTAPGQCWASGTKNGVQFTGREMSIPQSYCSLPTGATLLKSSSCSTPLDAPCMDQVHCRTAAHNGWFEVKDPKGESAQCDGVHLCGNGGRIPLTEPICQHMFTSGDLKFDHPCRTGNEFNETCIKELCDSNSQCGGYQKKKDGSTFWLHAKGLQAQKYSDDKHECWTKPLDANKLQTNCTCVAELLLKPISTSLLVATAQGASTVQGRASSRSIGFHV